MNFAFDFTGFYRKMIKFVEYVENAENDVEFVKVSCEKRDN